MSEAGHSVLNLDVGQLMVKSVLGILRTGKDDRWEIYIYNAEVCLVPHGEVMDLVALQKCRAVEVLFEGRNTGVPVIFPVYKSCCLVLDAFEEPGGVGVPCSRCIFQARSDESFISN